MSLSTAVQEFGDVLSRVKFRRPGGEGTREQPGVQGTPQDRGSCRGNTSQRSWCVVLRHVSALGFAATVVLLALVLGCAARRQASDLHYDRTPGVEQGDVVTPEELIRERDMMTLESFQELQQEMDHRVGLSEEGLLLEEDLEEDSEEAPEFVEPEPPGLRYRAGRTLEKAGLVTWAVFTVAFSLGMAALPFLI